MRALLALFTVLTAPPLPAQAGLPAPPPPVAPPVAPVVAPPALDGVPAAGLPARLDTLDAAGLEAALGALPPQSEALPWACLRLGRLRAHVRDFNGALTAYRRGLAATSPTHPARTALAIAIQHLEARSKCASGRIAALLPLSGPYAAIGKGALAAIKLAALGDATTPASELVVEDTAGDADRAAQAVTRLAETGQVCAIVGPVGALESQAAALAAERAEVTLVTLTGGEGVTGLGPFSFRHRLTRAAYARSLAKYAVEAMGMRSFAILYPESDYGREMRNAFWHAVEQTGARIEAAEGYSPSATGFNEPVRKLVGRYYLEARARDERWAQMNRKSKDPAMHVPPIVDFEAVFIADTGDRARQLLSFLAYWDVELRTSPDQDATSLAGKYGGELPSLVQVLGTNGFNSADFAARAGDVAHNAIFLDEFMPDAPAARDFVTRFQASTGGMPDSLAAHAYDATRMLALSVAGAGARPGEKQADRGAVRRKLLELRDFPGVVGTSRFNGDGELDLRLNVLTINPEGRVEPRWTEQGYGGEEPAPDSP